MNSFLSVFKGMVEDATTGIIVESATAILTTAFTAVKKIMASENLKNSVEDMLDRLEISAEKTDTKVDDLLVQVLATSLRSAFDMKDEDRDVVSE